MLHFVIFALVTSQAWAINPNQRLAQGTLSYYGTDFKVKNNPALKSDTARVLNMIHTFRPNKPDVIAVCENSGECYRHKTMSYTEARLVLFGELHSENDRAGKFVEDVYCMKKFYFTNVRDLAARHDQINVEHTWPQSRFNTRINKDMQKTDLHHLYPTESQANSIRGNHIFGEAPSTNSDQPLCNTSQIHHGRSIVFTPPAQHKGNVARSLFYFSVKYDLPISAEEEKVLREWHAQDPVDSEEEERHDKIAAIQLTRNPFIDYPEMVDEIKDF